jgi:hypothetical protein
MAKWFWLHRRIKKGERRLMARLDIIQQRSRASARTRRQSIRLTAGQVTDEELAALGATVQSVDDQVKAIYEPAPTEPPVA